MINDLLSNFTKLFGAYFNDVFAGLVILLTVYWYARYDTGKLGGIRKSLSKVNKDIEGMSTLSTTDNMKRINEIFNASKLSKSVINTWTHYLEDFMNSHQEKAPEISGYFSLERIITIPACRKRAEVIPGVLTMTGILATFLGIANGLKGLDIPAGGVFSQQIMNDLLSTVASAFSISIIAIFAAVVFQLLDRRMYQSAVAELSRFLEVTARKIPMVSDAGNIELLVKEQKAQTERLSKLGKDISSEIGKYIGNDLAPTINNSFVEAVKTQIAPAVAEIGEAVQRMSAQVVEIQHDGIRQLTDSFMDRLNTIVGDQFRDMGNNVKSLCENQQKAERSIRLLIDEIEKNMGLQQKSYIEASQVLNTIVSYQKQVEGINSSIGASMDGMIQFNEKLRDSLDADKQALDNLNELRKATQLENHEYFEKMDGQVTKLMEELNSQLDMAFSRFNDITTGSFEKLDGILTTSADGINVNMKALLDKLDDQVRDITLYARGLTEEVGILNEKLETSVQGFGDQLNSGVMKTLVTFDDGLAEISKRFGEVISDISDSVEDLPRVLGSIGKNKG